MKTGVRRRFVPSISFRLLAQQPKPSTTSLTFCLVCVDRWWSYTDCYSAILVKSFFNHTNCIQEVPRSGKPTAECDLIVTDPSNAETADRQPNTWIHIQR